MSGVHRLLREGSREFPAGEGSDFYFGVIALAALATVAVALTLMFPDSALTAQALLGP